MTLTDQILKRTSGRPIVRYGFVESISGGLASVRIGSTVVENATWCRGYAPILGDRVAVLTAGTGWLILDAVEAVQRAHNEPQTTLVKPSHLGGVNRWLWSESWDDNLLTPEIDPKYPEPLEGREWDGLYAYAADPDSRVFEDAGYSYAQAGDGSVVNYVPSNGERALFTWYPQLSGQVPDNAVITNVAIVLRQPDYMEGLPDWAQPVPGAPAVLHAHAQSPPPVGPGVDASQPPEYFFASGYDPVDTGGLNPGDLLVQPLPDDIADGLADGSLRGLAVWDGPTQVRTILGDWVRREYVYDVNGDYWYWNSIPLTDDCLSLQVTYITPVEDSN